ncbi:glucans biosynthesis glucosyltransferase H [Colletotrichum phormii]|uniref:Glucans biosynthesis glucosyltransferase H n=1 Tax=Colletotrichum phormii TaxID=359342 RepID=A0AAI9ZEJ6_9PEZI|nr:glucans biosynthesis glucosyltransferase H [Colletotrichum phormii]KAK1623090.1 glucans biosynthesis glucosyltransferase H [Colletotrichum phormii]
MSIPQRRLLVVALNSITILPFLWINFLIFMRSKFTLLDINILLCGTICIPWPIVSFWNSAIGLCIILFGNAEKSVYPYFRPRGLLPELTSTAALAIFMRNEDPIPVFDRLYAMQESLQQTGCLKHFRFVLISDTDHLDVAQMEHEAFAQHAAYLSKGMAKSPIYRRRDRNTGYKAGNLKDYLDNHSKADDFFVTLDSDSAMSGDLLCRLVSSMERNPHIGLLQTIVIGMPAVSAFTRLYQFGLRHGVRTYNMGFSWWAHDCALYWGHNAIIRTKAFHEHCMLPKLPGKPPLGGYILSHDLLEAMSMRRGGYEVRVLPIETESYETNPPTFLDFLRRELCWCQGTMQYWFMLSEPGIHPISRFQVYQTLTTYIGQACCVLMTLACVAKEVMGEPSVVQMSLVFSWTLHLVLAAFGMFPKLAGVFEVVTTSSRRYGGSLRCILSTLMEMFLMTLIAPITAVAVAVFLGGLLRGKSITWDGQNCDRLGLSWCDSFRVLWPQTVLGFEILLAVQGTATLAWVIPSAVGLLLAVPIAVITASSHFGNMVTSMRLFEIPEETQLPPLLPELIPTRLKRRS